MKCHRIMRVTQKRFYFHSLNIFRSAFQFIIFDNYNRSDTKFNVISYHLNIELFLENLNFLNCKIVENTQGE